MSQKELADALGYDSDSYISHWETGHNEPALWYALFRMSQVLSCSSDYLLGISDEPESSISDDLRDLDDSFERLTEIVGEDFADDLIDFMQSASEDDILALTAFVRTLKEVKESRKKI